MQWYQKNEETIFTELDTNSAGLSREQVAERQAKYGDNVVGDEDAVNYLAILLHQLTSPLVVILLIAAAVTIMLGEFIDSGVIGAVVVLNGLIGFIQESKAEKSVRSLQKMVTPKALVMRDGKEMEVDSRTLQPGDIVMLFSGAMVPADIRLIEENELRIDESMLTGESLPSGKCSHLIEEDDLSPGDQRNMAFMGTIVVNGRGKGVVTDIGLHTMLGGIARDIRSIGKVAAPIQEKIERLAKAIGVLVLGAASMLFVLGLILGESIKNMFLTAVAVSVATVPEGLPIVVTIAMAVGVKRMASYNAVIRKLSAVETLGSTTVICSDKTGTLTVNRMTVTKLFDGKDEVTVTGTGYIPEGEFKTATDEEAHLTDSLRHLLRIGLLCNESRLVHENESWEVEGDPTEGALIVSALKAGLTLNEAHVWPEIAILPFESDRGYMATLHEHAGKKIMFVKGGHDRLMASCSEAHCEGVDISLLHTQAHDMAAEGLRVLAFAVKEMPPETTAITDSDVMSGLKFVGLQGMMDPPRPEAIEAVTNCQSAGIRVVMITGDHADTASAIARMLGITATENGAITGTRLAKMDDDEFAEIIQQESVFARIAPDDKFRIINTLKEQGEIVAVTGDGVNDAPALQTAHIGVSMGKGGTDVARESSDMVLIDDNFSSIFHAVREGRIVFDNLRKAIFFLLPTGLAAVWSILFTMMSGLPIPFVAAQLLWINLVTNGLQDVAFAFEPGEPDVTQRSPRPPSEGIINSLLLQRTVIVSFCIAIGVYAVFSTALDQGVDLEKARTLAMTTMVFFQFFQAINSRAERASIFTINPFSNHFLLVSMILAVSAQITVVYASSLAWIFRTRPLTSDDWILCLGVASTVIVVVELEKLIRRCIR
ncbi:cation-translocating P-type ATPase [Halodesulfovibrio spirochaetisodalis]|uniref:ATPase n=1 Tax=Halodesulfovibrio spirochaetisodalis TaxID=1560234 RepID=A0A1B7XEW8_9BACT|nr:HAD-IC family P-type ATPase [Halodesulfovibrio spirochaetisodalis]OBQ52725.1 ATPase [Halodesulfovibrio spirochaetisodalis]